jgi:hypothetical protein
MKLAPAGKLLWWRSGPRRESCSEARPRNKVILKRMLGSSACGTLVLLLYADEQRATRGGHSDAVIIIARL